MNNIPQVTIYTDGSSRGNPGPGGYGVVMLSGKYRKEISQGYRKTTNNRMELLAVIIALEALKINGTIVNVYTDSKYVSEAINQNWIESWQSRGFIKVKNPDLWKRFIKIYSQHKVSFHWVKGHSTNVENNRCDHLAVEAALSKNLLIDEYYESSTASTPTLGEL